MISAEEILEQFGEDVRSDGVQEIFGRVNTLRRPTPLAGPASSFYDWVLVKKKGLELGFVDSNYFDAKPIDEWGAGELLLVQATFYLAFEGLARFAGDLPFRIHKDDHRTDVRRKLAAFEHTRKSWVNDVWEIGTTRLTAIYSKDSECLERLAFRQMPRPIPAVNVATTGDLIDFVALLGHAVQSPTVQQVFGRAFVREADDDEIDLRMTHGVTLHPPVSEWLSLR